MRLMRVRASLERFDSKSSINMLNRGIQHRPITSQSLQQCITSVWQSTKHVDIIIEKNEYVLEISTLLDDSGDSISYDGFSSVTQQLNDWNLGHYTLQLIHDITDDCDVLECEFVHIQLGIPISRIAEFYGVPQSK